MGNVYTHTVTAVGEKDIKTTRDFLIEKGLNYIESPTIVTEYGDGKMFVWFEQSCENIENLMSKLGGKYEKN